MFFDGINRIDRMLPAGRKPAAADNNPSPALMTLREADAYFGPLIRSNLMQLIR